MTQLGQLYKKEKIEYGNQKAREKANGVPQEMKKRYVYLIDRGGHKCQKI